MRFTFFALLSCLLLACGDDDRPTADGATTDQSVSGDPLTEPYTPSSSEVRCSAICKVEVPNTEGVGEICSRGSADTCVALCEARINGTAPLCTTCLLEDADFPEDSPRASTFCHDNDGDGVVMCELSGNGQTCSYPADDSAMELACKQQTDPRRAVECDVDFQDTSECTAECS